MSTVQLLVLQCMYGLFDLEAAMFGKGYYFQKLALQRNLLKDKHIVIMDLTLAV